MTIIYFQRFHPKQSWDAHLTITPHALFPWVTSGILYPSFCLLEVDLFKFLHVNKMPSIYSTVLIRYRTPSLQPLDYQTSQISCKRPVVIHYSQWSSHWKTYCLHTICWVHGKPANQPFLSFTSYLRKQASFRWYHAVRQQQVRNSLRSSKYLAVLLFLQLCQRNAIHLPPLSVTELSSRSLLRIKTILAIQSSLKTSGWGKHIPVVGVGTFSRGSTAQ